jgi:hypothetical protein
MNAPECYVMRALPILFTFTASTQELKQLLLGRNILKGHLIPLAPPQVTPLSTCETALSYQAERSVYVPDD